MNKFDIPLAYTKLIKSYLENRKFQVRINTTISKEHVINAGVSQGSVLGPPALFNLCSRHTKNTDHPNSNVRR